MDQKRILYPEILYKDLDYEKECWSHIIQKYSSFWKLIQANMSEWEQYVIWLIVKFQCVNACVVSLRSRRWCVSEREPPAGGTGRGEATISEPAERIFQTGAAIWKPAGGHVLHEGNGLTMSLSFWDFVFVDVFNMGFTHSSSIPATGGSPLTRAVWARTPTTPPSVCQRQETLMTPSSRWR